MFKIMLWYSLIGGILLISSRLLGSTLYYLSGYLYLLSYILIIALVFVSGKRINLNLNGFDYLKLISGTIVGMTLIYILFVLIKNKFFI
jgi:hypothetical protein